MKEKTVQELKQMIDDGVDFQLIDVREPHEYEACNINAPLIPLGTIVTEFEQIEKEKPVIIHCRSGARSAAAINELEKRFQLTNLYNLKGGIMEYAKEIDDTLQPF